MQWTSEGLKTYFNKIVMTNQIKNGSQGSSDWITKHESNDFKFWIRRPKPGSSEVAFRVEAYLPEDYNMQKLVPCIYDTNHLMNWDHNTDL